jgi:hypothetical protein
MFASRAISTLPVAPFPKKQEAPWSVMSWPDARARRPFLREQAKETCPIKNLFPGAPHS